jgi:DNA-binding MarR family transcriptional regulator
MSRDIVVFGIPGVDGLARYDGQARVQDLSGDMGITVSAVSKLVDRLERDRLAVRRPNPADLRSSLIALTDAGGSRLTAALEVARAVVARAVGGEEMQPQVTALARLQARLDNMTAGVAA